MPGQIAWRLSTPGFLQPLNKWYVIHDLILLHYISVVSSTLATQVVTIFTNRFNVSRDSVVGIATRYGLGGPGIESRWRRNFPQPSRPALGSTEPPTQWVPGLSQG